MAWWTTKESLTFIFSRIKAAGTGLAIPASILSISIACIATAHYTSYLNVVAILSILALAYAIVLDVREYMTKTDGHGSETGSTKK